MQKDIEKDVVDALNVEYGQFVLENQDYYLGKFKKMESKNKSIGWNWAAFFFSGLWFVYRKMYGIGVAITLATIGIDFVFSMVTGFGSAIASLVISVFCGLLANGIYFRYVKKSLATSKLLPKEREHIYCMQKGGTDMKTTVIIICIVATYTLLSSFVDSWFGYIYDAL